MTAILRILTLAALASSALATPATGLPADNAVSMLGAGVPGAGQALVNPIDIVLHAVESAMSNGERMRRGLPPKKPHFRRGDRTHHARAQPSSTPATASTQSNGCTPRTGVVRATAPARNGAAALDGFLANTGNDFGEYRFTAARDHALRVTINDCNGAPFDIVSSNGFRAYPYVGGITGFSSDGSDLRSGSYNYLYIGGVTETDPRATPQNVGNSFTAATDIQEAAESAIWSFGSGNVLQAQWINTDGSAAPTTLAYYPADDTFILVGDVAAFESQFTNVQRATFTFES